MRATESYRLDESQYRAALGATSHSDIARIAGVSRVALWRWRSGHPAARSHAVAIASALGVQVSDLWINWGAP